MKRLLLKISGEALMGNTEYGISTETLSLVADKIISVHNQGIELSIVLGGGNIFRGVSNAASGMDRAVADYMGMLATVMNAIALQNILSKKNIDSLVLSALDMPKICESYTRRSALSALESKKIVIFAAGTGNPYFSTDTAAVLRANEMHCDMMIKATKVAGLYDKDPTQSDDAQFISHATYQEVLEKNLQVMDLTAIALAKENKLPIMICSIYDDDIFLKLINNEGTFTLIKD